MSGDLGSGWSGTACRRDLGQVSSPLNPHISDLRERGWWLTALLWPLSASETVKLVTLIDDFSFTG